MLAIACNHAGVDAGKEVDAGIDASVDASRPMASMGGVWGYAEIDT